VSRLVKASLTDFRKACGSDGYMDADLLHVPAIDVTCDIQVVHSGTADETYSMVFHV